MKRPSSGGRKSTRSNDNKGKSTAKRSAGPRVGKSKSEAPSRGKKPARAGSGPRKQSERSFDKDPKEGFKPKTRSSEGESSYSSKPERSSYGKTSDWNKPERESAEGKYSKDGERSSDKRPSTRKSYSKDGERSSDSRPSTRKPYAKDSERSSDSKPSTRKPYAKDGERSSGTSKPYSRDGGKRPYGKPGTGRDKHFIKRSSAKLPTMADPDKGIRLNKYIANSGICSRREADELILAGTISINEVPAVELGTKVNPGDVVRYNGSVIKNELPVYILLNKPKDYITTTEDPKERKTVMHLIAQTTKARVYPVGRLDRNTTGLLLLTNDGDLTTRLTHPSFSTPKIYAVELDKPLKTADLQKIAEGLMLEDGMIKPDEIKYVGDDKRQIGIEIHSGKNRIVRRIFAHLNYEVLKLDRVMFAGLTKKDLPRGKFRNLSDIELSMLKMITGKKKRRTY